MASADTLRRRRCVVDAVAHGDQLHRFADGLLLALRSVPHKRQMSQRAEWERFLALLEMTALALPSSRTGNGTCQADPRQADLSV